MTNSNTPKVADKPTIAKNQTAVSTSSNGSTPQVSQPVQTVTPTVTTPTPPTVQVIEKPKPKTLTEVFEKLRQGNQKTEFYNAFCERLEQVERFRANHDGSGLTLVISNNMGEKVNFASLSMILNFIDEAIKQGKQAKENLEMELLNLSI